MIFKIFVVTFIIILLRPSPAHAFLPPEFFVQGLSSLLIVLSTGIAFAFLPLVLFWKWVRRNFVKHRRVVIFLIIQNIIIVIVLGFFFYYKFYKPLYEDSYLFPQDTSSQTNPNDRSLEFSLPSDPRNFNSAYIMNDGIIKDERQILIDYDYGIEIEDIKAESTKDIYYLDIREIEEFEIGHISNSKHIRHADITGIEQIQKIFGLDEGGFKKALIVVYCHDGDRGFYTVKNLGESNVKYLIGGIESVQNDDFINYSGVLISDMQLFGQNYQKDFQILAHDAIKLIRENEIFVIDMRLGRIYAESHLEDSLHFLFNTMDTEEYEKRLNRVLENKDKKFLFIVNRYTELFYTNLLIKRLTENYNFDIDKFNILFNQFHLLESDKGLKFDGGYPPVL